jgi:hypothetical protein
MANPNFYSPAQPLNPNISVWRYMDLAKFVSILQTNALVFSRADMLGDPFEGSTPKSNTLTAEQIEIYKHHIKDTTSIKAAGLIEKYIQLKKDIRKATFISCWHMNDAESAAMWKLYSHSRDAVAIKTDYITLANSLPREYYIGIVQYIDFQKEKILPESILGFYMHKRKSFAHENEARIVVVNPEPYHMNQNRLTISLPIDINALIKEVYIAPDAAEWLKDVVYGLCEKYGLNAPVYKSELYGEPLF